MTLRDLPRNPDYGRDWADADAMLESRITCEDAVRGVLGVLADGMPLGQFLDTLSSMDPAWTNADITAAVNRVGLVLTEDGRVMLDRRRQ